MTSKIAVSIFRVVADLISIAGNVLYVVHRRLLFVMYLLRNWKKPSAIPLQKHVGAVQFPSCRFPSSQIEHRSYQPGNSSLLLSEIAVSKAMSDIPSEVSSR